MRKKHEATNGQLTHTKKERKKKKKNEFERELTVRVPAQTTNIQKLKKRADFNRTIQNLC